MSTAVEMKINHQFLCRRLSGKEESANSFISNMHGKKIVFRQGIKRKHRQSSVEFL